MRTKFIFFLFTFLFTLCISAQVEESQENEEAVNQTNEDSLSVEEYPSEEENEDDTDSTVVSSPTIGFGIGALGFYGDLHDRNYRSPITANPAINIYLKQKINDFLAVRFAFMVAKIREEERSLERNVNFETVLRSGAIYLDYNFDNFLPKDRTLTPIVSVGLEMVEFSPKTDIKNLGGVRYNYWSDGSIRNKKEGSPNAEDARIMPRDYTYESDIRSLGYNPSTTYEQTAFAVPVGIGVLLKLNGQFNLRLESMMHLTFTDYIDGVTPKTSSEFVGDRKGNANNDHYLITSASLSYNFQKVPPAGPLQPRRKKEEESEPIDFLATGNTEDYDKDGVIDLIDECPNSPPNMEVDSTGCPVDSDKDGVPDYIDADPLSKNPNRTNELGVEVTDDMIYESYLRFNDSTLKYAETISRNFGKNQMKDYRYRVKVKEHPSGVTPDDLDQLLSIPELRRVKQEDKVIYTVGNYPSIESANEKAVELKSSGFDDVGIVEKNNEGIYKNTNREIAGGKRTMASVINEEVVVFRVQLGAFRNQPTKDHFEDVKGLLVVKSGDLYRYMSGSFNNFSDAAKYKLKMIIKGYKGAFVVPYKDGKRVSLQSVGINPLESDPLIGK